MGLQIGLEHHEHTKLRACHSFLNGNASPWNLTVGVTSESSIAQVDVCSQPFFHFSSAGRGDSQDLCLSYALPRPGARAQSAGWLRPCELASLGPCDIVSLRL